MICGLIFGLLFAMAGIYMLTTQKGWKVFSKRHEEVSEVEAKTNGLILLVIGLVLVVIMLLVK